MKYCRKCKCECYTINSSEGTYLKCPKCSEIYFPTEEDIKKGGY